jgi:adenosylcobinamide-phosphate synthase
MWRFPNSELALAALTLEACVGYPGFVYRAIGHPVTWMGDLLGYFDQRWNRQADSITVRKLMGLAALAILLAVTAAGAQLIEAASRTGWAGIGVCILAASALPAQRSLYQHVQAVADALEREGMEAGRKAVSMIVGRNPELLDGAGVARAAIESLAENFSDGIVAPTFWMVTGGLTGAALYKAVNTADSMIGHRTPRYAAFGWAAARLDDVLNLPAARLSALFLVLACAPAGASPAGALKAVLRDARCHRSPNAGWPEAAIAGAFGLKLGGPRVYGEALVEDAFMGDGRREANATDIRRALRVFRVACLTQWLTILTLCLILRQTQ